MKIKPRKDLLKHKQELNSQQKMHQDLSGAERALTSVFFLCNLFLNNRTVSTHFVSHLIFLLLLIA